MAYPYTPNTQGILNELKSMLTNLKLSDGITPAYNTVVLGGVKEYLPQGLPYGNILLRKHSSKRKHHGGDIVEKLRIEIRGVFDYTDSQAAELQLIAVHDVLLPLLHKYATLQNTTGVYHAAVIEDSGLFEWLYLKPEWYRIDSVELDVEQYYLIQGGIQS